MRSDGKQTSWKNPKTPERPPTQDTEDAIRVRFCGYLSFIEVGIYILLGTLLGAAALLGVAGVAHLLWVAIKDWTGTNAAFLLIDRLLFVLMLLEILHTVRISIRSHMLVVEPFLIVGLIASIRRMLVLTLQAEALTTRDHWEADGRAIFHASMIELGVLALVIGVLVTAIFAMRRTRPSDAEHEQSAPGLS